MISIKFNFLYKKRSISILHAINWHVIRYNDVFSFLNNFIFKNLVKFAYMGEIFSTAKVNISPKENVDKDVIGSF